MTDMTDKVQRLEDIVNIQRQAIKAILKALNEGESFDYIDREVYPMLVAALKVSRIRP